MTTEEAIALVESQGVLLESGGEAVPNLVEAVVGGPISGSWWGHPRGDEIFLLTRAIRASKQILVCRLVGGKVTYVHRRVWAALVRLQELFEQERLGAIREIHSSSGKHEVRVTPFPDWVSAEVREEAERLTESEAAAQLGEWSEGISKDSRGEGSASDCDHR